MILGMAKIGIEEELEGIDIVIPSNLNSNLSVDFNPANVTDLANSGISESLV